MALMWRRIDPPTGMGTTGGMITSCDCTAVSLLAGTDSVKSDTGQLRNEHDLCSTQHAEPAGVTSQRLFASLAQEAAQADQPTLGP